MAITLHDEVLEAKILEIGRRTGLEPSAVIARAIEGEEVRLSGGQADAATRRLAQMQKLLAELPVPTDDERRAVRQAMDDMYDEDGLPR